MAEKTGDLIKLQFDFNTAGCLEIKMNGKWFRATATDFRSFDGPRRITEPEYIEKGTVNVPLVTYDYNGPVYMYGTNNLVKEINEGKIVTSAYWDNQRASSEKRGR